MISSARNALFMKNSPAHIILAGDIGGTKTSLALFSANDKGLYLEKRQTYKSASADSPLMLIEDFLSQSAPHPVDTACFGIAGPVIAGEARATNLPWTVSEKNLRTHFGWDHAFLLNDLVALAHAIPTLHPDQLRIINNRPHCNGTIGVVAAGTGLGESLLIWDQGSYHPCASEGGHKDFAPRNQIEYRFHDFLTGKYGHASIERVLSGQGIVNIYQFLRHESKEAEPAWLTQAQTLADPAAVISDNALLKKDPVCVQALDLFVELYAAEAGNLALQAMTTGGIFLGGGIAPKIAAALTPEKFLPSFCAKGRMRTFLETVPVAIIMEPHATLFGAASYAFRKR